VRAALVSFWHVHAVDYARQAVEHPDVELVAAWDEDAGRGAAGAERLGVAYEPSLPALLARDDLDAVIVTAPTTRHREVLLAAIGAGKHVFTEKVLAPTVAECSDIVAAAGEAGVVLMVSLPWVTDPATVAIQRVLADGRLGRIASLRVRLAHGGAVGEAWLPDRFYDPAEAVGGALLDLGCHPMYVARLLLGRMPDTVSARFGALTGRAVEDNAVAVLGYEDGTLGVVEAGFVTPRSPYTVEMHGTAGSLCYGTPEPRLLLDTGDGWRDVPLPDRQPRPFARFVDHVRDGTRPAGNTALAVDLTRLMTAAYDSHRSGRPVAPEKGAP
jgi:predicted dehydrogenase